MVTAFNETKCMSEWAEDLRCVTNYRNLRHRIADLGWNPELAITKK